MIEGQEPIEEHQFSVGNGEVIFGVLANILQLADNVIGKVSDSPGGEWREPGSRCHAVLPQQTFDHLKDASLDQLTLAAALNLDFPLVGGHSHVRCNSEEGVASDLLPTLDRLE